MIKINNKFLVSSFFVLAACQSVPSNTAPSNTNVRVVGLSYSTSEQVQVSIPSNNSIKLLSNKRMADEVQEVIFPGDILLFTIELEDPNYEFVSLLSINFNNRIIRANVDNSIVSTRDCGANICVEFPFEITADKSKYSVLEVKFAKVSSENGVSAIIDNQSIGTVLIDAYIDEIYPYVVSSVALLNELFSNMEYINVDLDEWQNQWENKPRKVWTFLYNRFLSIINLEDSPSTQDGTYQRLDNGTYNYQHTNYDTDSNDPIDWETFLINASETYFNAGYYPYRFSIDAIHSSFQNNITASNNGNYVYINIKGNQHFLIEMGKRTRFIPFQIPLEFFISDNLPN